MGYSSYTLEKVIQVFGVKLGYGSLFDEIGSVAPPKWLVDYLDRCRPMAFLSEKSRSECIVTPILAACRELLNNEVFIYSGATLNVDVEHGLVGECDFLLAYTKPTLVVEAPLLVVLEAKKQDMELGLGQCAAQMMGARIFNETRKHPVRAIFGCVTSGVDWRFMKLEGGDLTVHSGRLFMMTLDQALWALTTLLKAGVAQATAAAA